MKIIDMHCDTITELYNKRKKEQSQENLRHNSLHIDLEKLQKGQYMLQNFAIFQSLKKHPNMFEDSIHYIDYFYQEMEANQDVIRAVRSYEEIEKNQREGKISALLTIEEGGEAEGKLEYLRTFYRLGVRMITLTWNFENGIGYPNFIDEEGKEPDRKSRNTVQGLTEYGIAFVEEMERLGMIIDVSHLSDAGFYDVLRYTRKPFVASHSNTVHCCNHCRNVTDDMIRRIAERGGVMGINFYPPFLDEVPANENRNAYASIQKMIAHIKHMRKIGGIGCIGLGTDFDGIEGDVEITNASHIQKLVEALRKADFTENEIEAICYKNVLRVYKEIL
ncbi:dipeptidase [Anaerosporobacter faecicola]|uniref:dipeptidase n=1 Tax=Anaerosporobacter faecicola TaxID=2718714 RepID=UPI00143B44CD|nr:dipeptidase [Anaerosporobacter faecicola]